MEPFSNCAITGKVVVNKVELAYQFTNMEKSLSTVPNSRLIQTISQIQSTQTEKYQSKREERIQNKGEPTCLLLVGPQKAAIFFLKRTRKQPVTVMLASNNLSITIDPLNYVEVLFFLYEMLHKDNI